MVLLSSDSPAEGIFERSITTLCSMVAAPLNGVCLETWSDGSTSNIEHWKSHPPLFIAN